MNITEKATYHIRNHFSDILGQTVRAKSLFEGYGLFVDDNMFAIYQKEQCYLRAEKELIEILSKYSQSEYISSQKKALSNIRYIELPESVLSDSKLCTELILQSISQITSIKDAKKKVNATQIRYLPNLNIKHERLLNKILIFTVDELRQIGAESAYGKLKIIGVSVRLEFFWNVYAGLQNRYVFSLTAQEKQEALKNLNEVLYDMGLRKEQ